MSYKHGKHHHTLFPYYKVYVQVLHFRNKASMRFLVIPKLSGIAVQKYNFFLTWQIFFFHYATFCRYFVNPQTPVLFEFCTIFPSQMHQPPPFRVRFKARMSVLCSLEAENFPICAVWRSKTFRFVQFGGRKLSNLCSLSCVRFLIRHDILSGFSIR